MDFSMANISVGDFNYFDVTIASIVIILGIKGFMHGFIRELFGLLGLVGGVYFASRYADFMAQFIDTNFIHLDNTSLLRLIGFIVVLIIIWLGATILGAIISKLTSYSGLGFINRLLGFIAGGGKYFIIFALIVTALSNVKLAKDNLEKFVADSQLYPILRETGSLLINLDTTNLNLGSIEVLDNNKTTKETNTTE